MKKSFVVLMLVLMTFSVFAVSPKRDQSIHASNPVINSGLFNEKLNTPKMPTNIIVNSLEKNSINKVGEIGQTTGMGRLMVVAWRIGKKGVVGTVK
ncbi:hypothetical protein OSSY52_20570 [Tepiditoga spiralis]|uniref:Uncharacterized protein n=1 Tax=Tepiditoga spiralis TaxID=2108365 RepID=A0A7G1G8Z9_9BACT|nr:hypothetical protein [Tepiditoga spiralis]BBE31916.1 hypothetical protein OSSY52_20570 [Tepiditoga spiralis]